MSEATTEPDYIQITTGIVTAFVSNNAVRVGDLPTLIEAVHAALGKAGQVAAEPPPAETRTPAVPVKRSITDEYIICLEDGRKFKSLKRHLSTAYNLTPDQYRARWGLGRDYPMVAPSYASARSNLARAMGLGRKREGLASVDVASPAEAEKPVRRRGRPRLVKDAA